MKNFVEKNKIKKLFFAIISELICFFIIRINLIKYDTNNLYLSAMNIVQILYFLPILLLYIFFYISKKVNKKLLIFSTMGLIIYSIFLHFCITPITSFFTNTPGIINFTKYASKIYFICLPLISFRIFIIFNCDLNYVYFLTRFILFTLITFIFDYYFGLKGILYSNPLCELLYFIFSLYMLFQNKAIFIQSHNI